MTINRHVWLSLLLLVLLLAPSLGFSAPPQAAGAKPAAKEGVSLDFKDIELADLIQTVSELTGRNFIYDETVRGKVTIISPRPLSLEEAYQLFLTVLNVKGFTVVPSGKMNKIVATKDAKESNLPTYVDGERARTGEQYVTRLVPLQNVDATLLATTVLTPLIPKTSNVVAYPPTNTLIITDSAANIERLVQIVHQLDTATAVDQLTVFSLAYADANETAQILNQVLAQAASTPRRARAAVPAAAGASVSRIIPYPRTNKLVVMGSEDDLVTIRTVIDQLDQKAAQERSNIKVYYLENADAETLAKTLNEILTGIKTQARQARPAVAGQAAPTAPLASEPVTITADKPTNALIINSSPEDYEILQQIVKQLDVKRKQVFVEALVLELSMDATQRLGASLQGAASIDGESLVFGTSNLNTGPVGLAQATSATQGVPNLLGQSIEGILLGGLFNPVTVTGLDGNPVTVPALSALIDVSRRDADVNILSAPRLLTSDNEEAEIIVGSNVPIITSRLTDTGGSTGLAQSVTIERKDVALTLRFTPQITEGNLVRLNVLQEITDLSPTSVGDVNEVGPTLTKRLVRNTVLAENGRTVVLGGLIGNNVQETVTKTPLLGDIPGLGWLFKRKSTTSRKTNLLLFITPHIIRSSEDLAAVTHKSRNDMDLFKEQNITPGWSIDPPPARPEPAFPPVTPGN